MTWKISIRTYFLLLFAIHTISYRYLIYKYTLLVIGNFRFGSKLNRKPKLVYLLQISILIPNWVEFFYFLFRTARVNKLGYKTRLNNSMCWCHSSEWKLTLPYSRFRGVHGIRPGLITQTALKILMITISLTFQL